MKKAVIAGVVCTMSVLAASSGLAQASGFSDIKGHWAEKDILDMADSGVVHGYPDGTFHPDDGVHWDEFVAMTFNNMSEIGPDGKRTWAKWWMDSLQGVAKDEFNASYFTKYMKWEPGDDYWARQYVEMAGSLNIQPLGGQFERDYSKLLTRGETAFLLYSFLAWSEHNENRLYSDLAASYIHDLDPRTYRYQILDVYLKGIMTGYPDGTFRANQVVTRAEALSLLKRMKDKSMRKPFQPDLSHVPYAVVPQLQNKRVIVFDNDADKNEYDNLLKASKTTKGFVIQYGTSFRFYDNEDDMRKDPSYSHDYDAEDPPFQLSLDDVVELEKKHYMFISSAEGALNKHESVLQLDLENVFGDEAKAVREKIDKSLQLVRSGNEVKENDRFNGRDVLIKTAVNTDNGHRVGVWVIASSR